MMREYRSPVPTGELKIQTEFVAWFSKAHGYKELLSDPNGGAAALMDSIGALAGKPVLIEFKHKLAAVAIVYTPQKTSSVERKICKSLHKLQIGLLPIVPPLKSIPTIYVVAERIPAKARALLWNLLVSRSREWCFKYSFGEWTGGVYRAVAEDLASLQTVENFAAVRFPEMRASRQFRSPSGTSDKFSSAAEINSVDHEFQLFIQLAKARRLGFRLNVASLLLSAKSSGNNRPLNAIGIWPTYSNGTDGLLVTLAPARLDSCFPGFLDSFKVNTWKEAPMKGFLDSAIYLKGANQVREFWGAIPIHVG